MEVEHPQIERITILNRGTVYSIRCKDGKLVLGKTKDEVLRQYYHSEGVQWRSTPYPSV